MAKTPRVYLGKANLPLPKLDLVAVQQNSYTWFLTHGIREAFNEINPAEGVTAKTRCTLVFLLSQGKTSPSSFSKSDPASP